MRTKGALSTYVHKLQRNIFDYGLSVAVTKSLQYLVRPVFEHRTYRLYKFDLTKFEPVEITDDRFRFRVLTPDDVNEITQVECIAEWLKGMLRGNIAANDMCAVVMDGDVVAAFNIISFNTVYIPLINRYRTSKPGQAWSEHIAVHKDYRKLGLGTKLRQFVFKELIARKVRFLYGGTLTTNFPALKLARKVGFKEIVDVSYTKVLLHKHWSYEKVRS